MPGWERPRTGSKRGQLLGFCLGSLAEISGGSDRDSLGMAWRVRGKMRKVRGEEDMGGFSTSRTGFLFEHSEAPADDTITRVSDILKAQVLVTCQGAYMHKWGERLQLHGERCGRRKGRYFC